VVRKTRERQFPGLEEQRLDIVCSKLLCTDGALALSSLNALVDAWPAERMPTAYNDHFLDVFVARTAIQQGLWNRRKTD